MNRRRARSVVLALFLLSFVGPWGIDWGSDGGRDVMYFPELIEAALKPPFSWGSALVASIMGVPVACLAATLGSGSRLRAIVYRVLTGGVTASLCGVFMVFPFPEPREFEAWGFSLYLATLVLAVAVEVIPARRPPKREYADVFR